jgi:phosphoserine aminotransferase
MVFGNVNVVASSKDKGYTYIPREFEIPSSSKYFHYTTNNTIEGTQMSFVPQTKVPLVADMSSDVLSRVMDFNQFDLIYAGAQKNIGAAGVNMVVLNKSILGQVNRKLPSMMDYRQHIEAGSMLNTPPVFPIYVCLLTLRWLKQQGGVSAIEKLNSEKANLLYKTLDELPMFTPSVAKEDRSKMNVVFVMPDKDLEAEFLKLCKEEGMVGVKGHRSVGGFRASLYNALPLESVKAFTDLMRYFSSRKS